MLVFRNDFCSAFCLQLELCRIRRCKPRILFEGRFLPTPATSPNYDVSRDGQRFLTVKAAEPEEQSATQINIVFNGFEELKRRVPPGRN
jgi:hypothetical protein